MSQYVEIHLGVSEAVETALDNIHLLHHHLDIEQVLVVGMES